MQDIQDSYRQLFLSESQEYLIKISNCLIKLEEDPTDSESINEIFRCVHTLKGMSATMGYEKLAQLSHQTEDLLDEIRSQRKKLTSEIIDRLFVCVDIFAQLVEDIRLNKDSDVDISPYIEGLKKVLTGGEKEKIDVSPVDIEADISKEPTLTPRTVFSYIKKIESMRIPVKRLDKIMNLMGELAIAKIRLMQIIQSYNIQPLEEVSFLFGRLISLLQDEIMQTRLLPVAYILDAFPRIVRDLAKREDKEVDLEIKGSEIELDRMVLDEISDPLIHLVRNALDHGIESPQQRQALKKDRCGKILINVTRQRGQIFIEVSDDGKGVDFEAVRRIALRKGLISQDETRDLDEKKILELITAPGFSTLPEVTEVSGRGVGLDVVKSKMEALAGRVDFESEPGKGSKFILTLPLTVAIIQAMLVKVEEEIYALPLMSVRETIKLKESELRILQNFEVARVRDEVIPTLRLNKEFGFSVPSSTEKGVDRIIPLVIIEHGKKTMGLVVSEVLGQQDIVVKPLGSLVKRTKGIAGATILGDGRVALILDIMSLR